MNDVNKNLGHATAYGYAKSKGYTGTEDEFAALMADYAAVGQRAEAAATAAAASATAASGSASYSAASATAAAGSATAASTASGNASQAATTATTKASEAAQSATVAAGSATTASTKASEAAQSALQAAGSATAAESAKTAAQTAQTAAETAQTAAETAQGAAEDAAESVSASAAQIAQNTADISSVKNALGATLITDTASGAIATFTDGADGVPMESVTVAMEPIQDLHGQDAPYPGGGGKNLCPIATMDTTSGGNINASCGAVGTVEAGVTYTFSLVNKTTSTANLHVRMVIDGEYSDVASGNLVSGGSKSYTFTPTVSGDVTLNASIGSVYSPAFENLQLEKGSTATTYAPYSNICPISGRSEVGVWRSGKNLLNPANAEIGTAWNGASNTARARLVVPIMPNTDYVLSMNGTNSLDGIYKTLSAVMPPTDIVPLTMPFSFNSGNNKYLVLGFTKSNIAQSDIDALKLQLELGTSATAYEAPNIQNVTIPLGQTVYSGTVDAVSGAVTITYAYVKDSEPADYGRNGATSYYLRKAAVPGIITSAGGSADVLSDRFRSTNESTSRGVCFINPTGNIRFNTYTPFDDISAMLTGIGVPEFVYLLATPLTIQLSAQQLTSLLGTNNVWSDGGNVSVEYVADTKAYIAKVIAAALA